MSLITPDFGLLVWMTLIFGIVFFLLAKFGFPVITRMVDERKTRIEESIAKAQEAERSLSDLSAKQQELIRQAREQQARILQEASSQRDQIISKAAEEARAEAQKILSQASEQIEAQKQNAMREIASQASMLSVGIAEKILRRELSSPESKSALIDFLCEEASSSTGANS